MPSTIPLLSKGMTCLINELGVVETERFISAIMRERFDYTAWQAAYFDEVGFDEFGDAAAAYAKTS